MSIGNSRTIEGALKPSSVEREVYNGGLSALRSTDVPSDLKMRLDYTGRTDGQPLYQGFAPTGLAEGSSGWLIYEFTYDASDNMTERNVAGADADCNWTARGDYTYD